jgi:hypothetical protein
MKRIPWNIGGGRKGLIILLAALTILVVASIALSKNLANITIYTARGLVSDNLDQLYADDDVIIVGNTTEGFSIIRTADLDSPEGKIVNYRGRSGADPTLRFGLQGFTKRASDGKIYAWYGHDIVEVSTRTIVYSSAPDYTHGGFGCGPKERFVTDESGRFWVGTENLDESGASRGENGLYRIAGDFSGKTTLLTDAIWNVFKDSGGTIWISSNKGIYKRDTGSSPTLVFDSLTASPVRWAEQVIEHDGNIYAVMKNFFHYPNETPTKYFELYRWNGTTFVKLCDIHSGTQNSPYAFVYGGSLYIKIDGGGLYLFNAGSGDVSLISDIGSQMGGRGIAAVGSALVSVGNIAGISIYNWGGSSQTVRLLTSNTAQALISDRIWSIYAAAKDRVFIGFQATGFNLYNGSTFQVYSVPDAIYIVGFFEYGGKTWVQGATTLYYLDGDTPVSHLSFPTNGERVYYDNGRLWAFPNWSTWHYGGIGMLNLGNSTIKGTKDSSGNDYWSTSETWVLDRQYHFYDVIAVPGEDAVLIAVGDDEALYPGTKINYVLKYSYASNTFSKVYLPDSDSQGIRSFASDGSAIYGAARQKLYKYVNGTWSEFCALELGNDFRGMKIGQHHLFIVSGWNSSGAGRHGGLEVVDLIHKTTQYYDSSTIAIPADSLTVIEIVSHGNNNYRLWLGTTNGLAYCNLKL